MIFDHSRDLMALEAMTVAHAKQRAFIRYKRRHGKETVLIGFGSSIDANSSLRLGCKLKRRHRRFHSVENEGIRSCELRDHKNVFIGFID